MSSKKNSPQDPTEAGQAEAVEFIGGPFDGHLEREFAVSRRLPRQVVWLVCENAFRLLEGREPQHRNQATSVAIYRLRVTPQQTCYRFVQSVPVSQLTEQVARLRP